MFTSAPEPPYTAVIFSSRRTARDEAGYAATAERLEALATLQPGYLGIESARYATGFGITVSYWRDDDSARAWKLVAEHAEGQRRGRAEWYEAYEVHVATVHRHYRA